MGNEASIRKSLDTDSQWLCPKCGIVNAPDSAKCKVCQTEAPPQQPTSPAGKKGTFFRSLSRKTVAESTGRGSDLGNGNTPASPSDKSKKSGGFSSMLGRGTSPSVSAPDAAVQTLSSKKKSEPKMSALVRMRTLNISKEENHALVFIKPSVPKIDLVRDAIEEHFTSFKCQLTAEGRLTAEDIASRGIIDKHYSALARNAMDLTPAPRVLTAKVAEDFVSAFGMPYQDDKVLTLGQFMKLCPEVTAGEIDKAWSAGKKVKLGGGLYVGRLEALEVKKTVASEFRPLLVVNGFYAAMRAEYTTPGNEVHYFMVEWKQKDLSWKDFRALVVGATDPTKADENSIRGKMMKHWKDLGLKEMPSIQNNCVHASAGPIEAMKERATWIELPIEKDPFAQAMLNEGVSIDLIKAWADNAQVTVKDKTGPAFDVFEDMDSRDVITAAIQLSTLDSMGSPDSIDISNGRKKVADSVVSEFLASPESPALKKLPNV